MEEKIKVEISQIDIDNAKKLLSEKYKKIIGETKLDLTDNIETYRIFRKIINFYKNDHFDLTKSNPDTINNVHVVYNKLLNEGITKTYKTIQSLDINSRVKTTLLYSFN